MEWFMDRTHSINPFLLLSMPYEANSGKQEEFHCLSSVEVKTLPFY